MLDEKDNGSHIGLDQGQALVIALESNPSTGYRWEVVETDSSILEQIGQAEFTPSVTGDPPRPGASGREKFHFQAGGPGRMTLKLVYARPWEAAVDPIKTYSIQVVVK